MYSLRKAGTAVSLKKQDDFKRVYSQGKYAANDYFVAYALANGFAYDRLGITVSKKVGTAVTRNRIKRLVREISKLHVIEPVLDPAETTSKTRKKPKRGKKIGMDIVIVARTPIGQCARGQDYFQTYYSIRAIYRKLSYKLYPKPKVKSKPTPEPEAGK